MHTNSVQLGISLLIGLGCLLPLYFQNSYFEGSKLRPSLQSYIYRDSASMIIALLIPIVLDTLADIADYFSNKKSKVEERGTFFNIHERMLFVLGIIICPVTGKLISKSVTLIDSLSFSLTLTFSYSFLLFLCKAFFPDSMDNLAFIYFCCNKSQLVISYGVLVTSLCRYNEEFWSVRNTYLMLFFMCAGSIIGAFSNNLYAKDESDLTISSVVWTAWSFNIFAVTMFFGCSGRWIFTVVYPKLKHLLSATESREREAFDNHLYFPLIFNIAAVLSTVFIIFILCYYWGVYRFDKNSLFLNNLAAMLYLASFYFVMIRMVKFEVVQSLYALIDAKKSYVRYISHELRTPLNSAVLGLKFLTDDIESSSDPQDIDR
jgi:hypothetical protein